MSMRFSKAARMVNAAEFARVKREGVRVRAGAIMAASARGGAQRLGLVVSRGVGNSVERNRIKRVIREFFRLRRGLFPQGDCVIIPSHGAGRFDNARIRSDLAAALEKLLAKQSEEK